MRSTLFYIPQFLPGDPFQLPVFGFGWLLAVWLIVGVALVYGWSRWSKSALDWYGLLPYIGLVAIGIALVTPNLLVVMDAAGNKGLPIRTYGLFMVAAVLGGVLLAAYRARRMGIDPEVIYSLAMLMTIAGIVGARAFFVIQYRDQFWVPNNIVATLQKVLNVPQGGLVVYGAVLGSFPVGVWYLWSRKLPPLVIADIVAPSMLLGLALGRLGCFMNGCCYGGFCSTVPPAVTFPAGSPPYQQHESQGWRTGVWLKQIGAEKDQDGKKHPREIQVAYVAPRSAAELAGVRAGDLINSINGKVVASLQDAQEQLQKSGSAAEMQFADGDIRRWTLQQSPERSAPVHPAQVYAAVDAGLLALLLWVAYPFRRRDGEITALMFTLHPPSRFLLEIVRVDEGGQFGTGLTISQWVSIGLFVVGLAIWWYVENQPRGSAVPARRLATA
jgi:phosphatidylglycerol:prolipoprotein diacylglycerol transferase